MSAPTTAVACDSPAGLRHAIEHAAEYLPTQGPITVFVHHNTLHALEDLPFEQAILEGYAMFGCEPYLSEPRYREEFKRGRIRAEDLREVLMADLGDEADRLIGSFGTRYGLRLCMLQYPLPAVPEAELPWVMAQTHALEQFRDDVEPAVREQMLGATRHWVMRDLQTRGQEERSGASAESTAQAVLAELIRESGSDLEAWKENAWRSFLLRFLWTVCRRGVYAAGLPKAEQRSLVRHRDWLLEVTGEDSDRWVNEVLIRFSASFLDQGFAASTIPNREQGFFRSFADLYSRPFAPRPRWMGGLRENLRALLSRPFDPLVSIEQSLDAFGVEPQEREAYLTQSLLALRGWAGMLRQMERHTPWAPQPAPEGTLLEYLAVRLILERYAVGEISRKHFGISELARVRELAAERIHPRPSRLSLEGLTLSVFHLAQVRGWSPEQLVHLSDRQWQQLVREIADFTELERRRILHFAYERQYHHAALDAVAIHCGTIRESQQAHQRQENSEGFARSAFQVVCCIDDREESFRRHLEEVDPKCETFGAAGFYAVAMYYQGAADAHFRPLCPNIITPRHYVREEPIFSAIGASARRSRRRRLLGYLTHHIHSESRTLIGGSITGVLGSLATFPMVARILAPRWAGRLRSSVGELVSPPLSELHLERNDQEPGPSGDALGYRVDEMAGIVVRVLQDIGLTQRLSPLVLFLGHGSSSMNNPHESAYCCGACSGGRGGPNARAFAQMANDPRVRAVVAEGGISIPPEVRFLGGYHDTCNDQVEYYDLDRLPRTHRALFRRIEASINETRARNAHERARRFESVPLQSTPLEALRRVEERAEDLSEARPEYNHATNALCFVGRREWSRGLYLDRRCFLTSYDPSLDDADSSILTRILQAAIPVCAGISLEYYFSTVDNEGYGCGSKLPHNIAALAGVMTGAASDLRPGLSAQMVEIHEPLRILFVVETTPEAMQRIIEENSGIARLVRGGWVRLAVLNPENSELHLFHRGRFEPYQRESYQLPKARSSLEWYRGWREHLDFASIDTPPVVHRGAATGAGVVS
ncbi:DUF2309 domain-containing protein [Candidatus Laterigemmans baculatus]|uniref:DUF2309 domain-containing protein n=1 Tax=Candidatus Laterigemmans baculatus TaxID=2770505 RepID=UPI0013DB07AA|nr:DUF2309 domain-containing protein [Candidatus Laterigemmans baculatus]